MRRRPISVYKQQSSCRWLCHARNAPQSSKSECIPQNNPSTHSVGTIQLRRYEGMYDLKLQRGSNCDYNSLGLTNDILVSQKEISCNPCQKTSLKSMEQSKPVTNKARNRCRWWFRWLVGWLSSVMSYDATTVSAANRQTFQGKKSVCHAEHCCCDALEVVLKQGKGRACLAYDGKVQNWQGTQTE